MRYMAFAVPAVQHPSSRPICAVIWSEVGLSSSCLSRYVMQGLCTMPGLLCLCTVQTVPHCFSSVLQQMPLA